MEDLAVREMRKRREYLHRRLAELRAQVKEVEARVHEVDGLWKHFFGKFDAEKVRLISPPDVAVLKKTGDAILYALSEFERLEFEGVERPVIVELLLKWSPNTKPNTIRVAFKRLIASRHIEKMGNLYRLAQTRAATSEKVAA
jgi:hypothetical protein